ncbi:hypothetical protein DAI22_11g020600 [Oryza sativa Japonica Group]|jgi:hypothetical protein|nr:hypothetical protein DAI22_11g020600 [Oryza sativa Japonica Group]
MIGIDQSIFLCRTHSERRHGLLRRRGNRLLLVLLLPQEWRLGVAVAAVEARVLLEPLIAQHRPGHAHQLPVAHRRRVRRQHGLYRVAERAARLAARRHLVVPRHVRRRLVRLAPAQQDAVVVGAHRLFGVAVELGAGVRAEEREEVVGDVVGGVDARDAGEVFDNGGVRQEPRGGGARGRRGSSSSGRCGAGGEDGGADLLLLEVDEPAAVARVGHHGEARAARHAVHEPAEVDVGDEVEVAGHDGLVALAVAVAAPLHRRDERAVAAVVEEENVAGRRAGDHVGQRALDVGAGGEHRRAAVVGEHGDVGRREAEAGDEGVAHRGDVVDAALQLVGRAGVVAPDQRRQLLLLTPLHEFNAANYCS